MILPRLGGSPAVWNTSLAFFQFALLIGYAYAHGLQRIRSLRVQMGLHMAVLATAALALPLSVTMAFGEAPQGSPTLWLLGVLALSIGAPFAALSATAPLIQAWHARLRQGHADAENPYVLYAASNLGSLLSLLAYPVIIEPFTRVGQQTMGWSLGYLLFGALVLTLATLGWGRGGAVPPAPRVAATGSRPITWTDRMVWLLLAAAPSSLLLGVSSHISTDVASAPFLWVVPLALYLVTFTIAFQDRPLIGQGPALLLQAIVVVAAVVFLPLASKPMPLVLAGHLVCFFLTALVCHQAMAARRPDPAHLTEFYLLMSLGGVVGGSFNAFVAPVIFNAVYEYPLVLVLACLARPTPPKGEGWDLISVILGAMGAVSAVAVIVIVMDGHTPMQVNVPLLMLAAGAAFVLRDRRLAFVGLIGLISISAHMLAFRIQSVEITSRNFFGVVKVGHSNLPGIGKVSLMLHGTTLHGAQRSTGPDQCLPMVYYAPATPLGSTMLKAQKAKAAMSYGVVGLGSGAVAAYVRPGDQMTFFEIDPVVDEMARNPSIFTYISACAKGPVKTVMGDARLSLKAVPTGTYDLLMMDAFASDAVPAHLLTVEAMRSYLRVIKPGGVIVMNLTNRHLDLIGPAAAVAKAAGGVVMGQSYTRPDSVPELSEASTKSVIIAKTPEALAAWTAGQDWKPVDTQGVRPWTDDYTNILGAMIAHMRQPAPAA
jgi:hypothetical protein